MRRVFGTILLIVSVLLFAGCAEQAGGVSAPETEAAAEIQASDAPTAAVKPEASSAEISPPIIESEAAASDELTETDAPSSYEAAQTEPTIPPETTEPEASTTEPAPEADVPPSDETAFPDPAAADETADTTSAPADTMEAAPAWRVIEEEELHLYLRGEGEPEEGKINIVFLPNNHNAQGEPDPDIQVRDSYLIRFEEERRQICEYILASPLYDPDVYGRTLDSMLTEWRAHNDINSTYDNERTRHVDFNRGDEGKSYLDFWKRAVEYVTGR